MKQKNKPVIYVVIGTRAQLIKTAPVMREMEQRSIDYKFIYTVQHRETIDDIRNNFGIKSPDYIFNTDDEAKTIGLFGKWLFRAIKEIILKRKEIIPEKGLLLTHGDTITCVLGAFLGKITGCKVMHLESGLRSFNIFKPFPEEITRIITFMLTDIYACPNEWAMNNLKKFRGEKLNTQMNTQYDSVMLALKNKDNIVLDLPKEKYVVVSIHRFEHIFNKDKLARIVEIIKKLSDKIKILFILHPATEKQLYKLNHYDELKSLNNVDLRKRYPFFEFIKLISNSEFVITDGGSNQEELSYIGKPALVLRDVTERIEGLNENIVLSKFDDKILDDFFNDYQKYNRNLKILENYPSKIIVDFIVKYNEARVL